ncbi:MAG: hypothetical protein ACRCWS_04800 [Propionibacteriaceae bacterium]
MVAGASYGDVAKLGAYGNNILAFVAEVDRLTLEQFDTVAELYEYAAVSRYQKEADRALGKLPLPAHRQQALNGVERRWILANRERIISARDNHILSTAGMVVADGVHAIYFLDRLAPEHVEVLLRPFIVVGLDVESVLPEGYQLAPTPEFFGWTPGMDLHAFAVEQFLAREAARERGELDDDDYDDDEDDDDED